MDTKLFSVAPNIHDSWFISANMFSIEDKCLDISINYHQNSFFHSPYVNKYHIMKIVTAAENTISRSKQNENILLKKTKYIWLKNPESLTIFKQKRLKSLKSENLKTVQAYNIQLSLKRFRSIYPKRVRQRII